MPIKLALPILVLLGALLMVAQPARATQTVLFREDFSDGPGRWQVWLNNGNDTRSMYPVTVAGGIASVTSLYPHDFALDYNHAAPGGMGVLNMAFWRCLPANGDGCDEAVQPLDLRNITWRVRIRATCCEGSYPSRGTAYAGPGSTTDTRLVPWFDTWDQTIGRATNMAAIGTPLDNDLGDGQWHIVEVAPRLNDWACLGTIQSQSYLYGCNPVAQVIGHVDVGFGLIFFPVDPYHNPVGRLEVDWIELVR
jgi:hypothetical protein